MANCGRDCQSQAEPESMLGAALNAGQALSAHLDVS